MTDMFAFASKGFAELKKEEKKAVSESTLRLCLTTSCQKHPTKQIYPFAHEPSK